MRKSNQEFGWEAFSMVGGVLRQVNAPTDASSSNAACIGRTIPLPFVREETVAGSNVFQNRCSIAIIQENSCSAGWVFPYNIRKLSG
jgi:hypothetical protein